MPDETALCLCCILLDQYHSCCITHVTSVLYTSWLISLLWYDIPVCLCHVYFSICYMTHVKFVSYVLLDLCVSCYMTRVKFVSYVHLDLYVSCYMTHVKFVPYVLLVLCVSCYMTHVKFVSYVRLDLCVSCYMTHVKYVSNVHLDLCVSCYMTHGMRNNSLGVLRQDGSRWNNTYTQSCLVLYC